MSVNMSRPVRRQLLACGMATSLIDACRSSYKSVGERIPIKVSGWIHRIRVLTLEASGLAVNGKVDDQGRYLLDAKATEQYAKAILSLQAEIIRQYGEKVDARDFVAAVLTVVEDTRHQIPREDSKRRDVWFHLASIIGSLLNHYDEDENMVDRGVARAEQFKRAAGW